MTDNEAAGRTPGRGGDATAKARAGIGARIRNLPIVGRALRRLPSRYPTRDEAHAPGHRHLGPPPQQEEPITPDTEPRTSQPWIRTSHSDSQVRRPRR